jgi:hypothetical protein
MSFAGAMIVFVTFVVKDGLREDWKDAVQSLNSARTQ